MQHKLEIEELLVTHRAQLKCIAEDAEALNCSVAQKEESIVKFSSRVDKLDRQRIVLAIVVACLLCALILL